MLPVEAVLLVADLADHLAREPLDGRGVHAGGAAHLAGNDHPVGGGQRLATDAGLRKGLQVRIDDRVGDAVADLVRMALRHRLAGEEVIAT
jgi:hypothetical protein